MSKVSKKQKEAKSKIDPKKNYSLLEASSLVKEITTTKFDASIDLAVRLGVDPKKANQMVRGVVTLPHGTGKNIRVLALVTPDKEADAKDAGADYVGLDEYLNKIKDGWTDVDVIVTMPSVMGKLGPLGRVLGPRGLMPNPKTGTVTMDIAKAISDVKAGKIDYRMENSARRWATAYDFPAREEGLVNATAFPNQGPIGMQGFVFNTRRALFQDRLHQ